MFELYLLSFNCARTLVDPQSLAPSFFDALPKGAPLPDLVAISLQEIAPIAYSFLGGKMGRPEDLMGAVTFLSSDASLYVTVRVAPGVSHTRTDHSRVPTFVLMERTHALKPERPTNTVYTTPENNSASSECYDYRLMKGVFDLGKQLVTVHEVSRTLVTTTQLALLTSVLLLE